MFKVLFSGEKHESFKTNFAIAILRIWIGLALAWLHGIKKFPPAESMITGLTQLGIPYPYFFAILAGLSEFVGGNLLALGMVTRVSALFIFMTMAFAAFIWHAPDPIKKMEPSLGYLFAAFFFLLVGGGKYSFDALFRKKYYRSK